MERSERLQAVARLVTEGLVVADIGTDHGYLPIHLVKSRICPRAIALDVNQSPLQRAKDHIREQGLSDRIETRLSDGLAALMPEEADSMVAAGMGGTLIIHILSGNLPVADGLSECILQPQSEVSKVRRYLQQNGWKVVKEDMVEEDGKYYPMMKAVHGKEQEYEEFEYRYGKLLLADRHPVLKRYLEREERIRKSILAQLGTGKNGRLDCRIKELEQELRFVKEALSVY